MEYVDLKDLTLKHSIFTWNIIDFFPCVKRLNFTSSEFSFMNLFWFIRLHAESRDHGFCIQVYLCRSDGGNEDYAEVKMRFAVLLKSPAGLVFSKGEREHSFETGNVADIYLNINREKIAKLKNDFHENSLVVICDMIAVGDEITYRISMEKRLFNEDILQLSKYRSFQFPEDKQKRWLYGNEFLLTEDGGRMRVHKEILSARSPVFRQIFLETSDPNVSVPFNGNAVEPMLKFLYFASVKEVIDDGVPHPDLYQCAVMYQISDLVKLLEPKRMYESTIPRYKKEYFKIRIPRFTKVCNQYTPLKSYKCCTTERKPHNAEVSIKCDTEKYSFKIVLEKNHPEEQSEAGVNGCFKFLDENQDEVFSEHCISSIEENIKFDFDVKIEKLFAKDNVVLPNDVLTLKCRFVTRLYRDREYSIPSPEFHSIQELTPDNGMEYLLENEIFADFQVRIGNVKKKVHKLIMAARSSKFMKELLYAEASDIRFETSPEITDELLFYMYTGELRNAGKNIDLLHGVSTFELRYGKESDGVVTGLRNKCIKEMYKLPLTSRNVLQKYSFAASRTDMLYKQTCKEFILANRGIILGNLIFHEFRGAYPELANEIVDFINQNFTKENKFV